MQCLQVDYSIEREHSRQDTLLPRLFGYEVKDSDNCCMASMYMDGLCAATKL